MKRTIITLLALLSLSLMVPAAYAQEYIPEVSTLSELQQAIAEAEPGDTISGNTALYGGGVYVLDNGKVQNCKLYQNTGAGSEARTRHRAIYAPSKVRQGGD